MCGENCSILSCLKISSGSPPRVRGKLLVPESDKRDARITPACAGKTWYSWDLDKRCEDHPRVCGENIPHDYQKRAIAGSPPRVRGKRLSACFFRRPVRITPACAGKTLIQLHRPRVVQDHPRVCGENPVQRSRSESSSGSPPRVRGKPSGLFTPQSI